MDVTCVSMAHCSSISIECCLRLLASAAAGDGSWAACCCWMDHNFYMYGCGCEVTTLQYRVRSSTLMTCCLEKVVSSSSSFLFCHLSPHLRIHVSVYSFSINFLIRSSNPSKIGVTFETKKKQRCFLVIHVYSLLFSECAVNNYLICTSGSSSALSSEISVSSTRSSSSDEHGADRACLNTEDETIRERGNCFFLDHMAKIQDTIVTHETQRWTKMT